MGEAELAGQAGCSSKLSYSEAGTARAKAPRLGHGIDRGRSWQKPAELQPKKEVHKKVTTLNYPKNRMLFPNLNFFTGSEPAR